MNRCLKGLILMPVLFSVFFAGSVFSMGGKIKTIPLKTFADINIDDGEYLRYGMYVNGKKFADLYFVTKIAADEKGSRNFRIHFDVIPVSSGRTPLKDYNKWPAYFIIDGKNGAEIESEGSLFADDAQVWDSYGMGGLAYWHYKLYRDKGYVEYTSRKIKDNKTRESSCRVKINPDIPAGGMWTGIFFGWRFADPESPGVVCTVNPEVIKKPLYVSIKERVKDSIQTKAGKFKINKMIFKLVDPFMDKLFGSFAAQVVYYVEDSGKRLLIKEHSAATGGGDDFILEEVSKVK